MSMSKGHVFRGVSLALSLVMLVGAAACDSSEDDGGTADGSAKGDASGASGDGGAVDGAPGTGDGPASGSDVAGPIVDGPSGSGDGAPSADGPGATSDAALASPDTATTVDSGNSTLVTAACSATPADFTGYVDFPGAVPEYSVSVCVDANGCRITNNYRISNPAKPGECALADRMFRLGMMRDHTMPFAVPGEKWILRWASTGITRGWPTTTTFDSDLAAILERTTDQVRYRVAYRLTHGLIRVSSAARFTDPIPPYGASADCSSLPRTYSTKQDLEGRDVYARLCLIKTPQVEDVCAVVGDVESTPETEPCSGARYSFVLGYDRAQSTPWAGANFPEGGASSSIIESASAGTLADNAVTGMPVNTDVSFVVKRGTLKWTIVARWTGTGYVVQSVKEM